MAALVGLALTFGGACGVGPTDLSLLAVSGTQSTTPDDTRGQVPVPAAAEVAEPARRRVLRRLDTRPGAMRRMIRRAASTWVAGVVTRRGPPPLRGPPAPVV
jgi:hypothetical protein